jgi:hypothetical protein
LKSRASRDLAERRNMVQHFVGQQLPFLVTRTAPTVAIVRFTARARRRMHDGTSRAQSVWHRGK